MELYAFRTQNNMKVLYVFEELQLDYDFHFVDLFKAEHLTPEFKAIHPFGKTPALKMGDKTLAESGAICRYVASVAHSPLYPADKFERAQVDQWLDFFSNHLGRALSVLYFEKVLKAQIGIGEPDPKACEDNTNYARQGCEIVDAALKGNDYLMGAQITIADLFAYAYVEQVNDVDFSLDPYPSLAKWFASMSDRPAIAKAKSRLPTP